MELELSTLLGTEAGSIDSLSRNLDDQVVGLEERIEELNARLDRRKEQLIRQFTAMEEALARAQSQADWLTAQLSRLDGIRDR
jgi:flagellar hook-associated protein 2